MPKKLQTNNQPVTQKEFKVSVNEISKKFEQVDKRFDEIEKKMATKDDLKNFATKDDIKQLDGKITILAKEVIKHTENIKQIKETMATKDDVRQILVAIDNFAGQTNDHEHKAMINTHRINELEPKVEDHEKRLTKIESNLPH